MLAEMYRPSLSLLTDLYQLTMAYGYWKLGRAEQEAVFHLFFRKPPFSGGYAIAAGLETVVEYLQGFRFDESDVEYLATLTGNDEEPLFNQEYLRYLADLQLTIDVDAMPEGTVAFGKEPDEWNEHRAIQDSGSTEVRPHDQAVTASSDYATIVR